MNIIIIILVVLALLFAMLFFIHLQNDKINHCDFETTIKIDEVLQNEIKNHLILKDKLKIFIAELLYIKSKNKTLEFFLSNGNTHLINGKLNSIIKKLPPNFIHYNQFYLVNSNFIKTINETNITLINKTKLPLSKFYRDNN